MYSKTSILKCVKHVVFNIYLVEEKDVWFTQPKQISSLLKYFLTVFSINSLRKIPIEEKVLTNYPLRKREDNVSL